MDITIAVPEADDSDSGVAGTQQAGTSEEVAATPPPLEGTILPRTVIGLVAGSPDHYGGAQNAPIIGALINDFAYDKEQARNLAAEKQLLLDNALAQLSAAQLTNARLEARLTESMRANLVEKVCTFFSPVLLSLGIDLFKSNATSSYLVAAIGVGLLLTNFIPRRGKN